MLTAIYKSPKKQETYLFLPKRDDFSAVPKALLETFGKPIFVMLMNLDGKRSLALADINKVKAELVATGFYLQLPPPQENLLKQHRHDLGLDH